MKAHLIGGGISSLAAAAYLFKDGGVLASNIHIYEVMDKFGGALDATGDPVAGYTMRGGRMYEEKDNCIHDLLSFIPSRDNPQKSIDEDLREFYATTSWHNKARLIGIGGKIVDAEQFGLSRRNMLDLTELMLKPQALLEGKTIEDCFDLSILKTNFWYMFGSIFAFLPWHSAIEMRRYLLRFFHLLPTMANMTTIQRTRYNQYEAIVQPMISWLKRLGVNFHPHTEITDINFHPEQDSIIANALLVRSDGNTSEIQIAPSDVVFVTLGSHVAGSTRGSMTMPPPPVSEGSDPSWELWERIAKGRKGFGHPWAFKADSAKSAWVTFTITTKGHLFADLMTKLTGSEPGRGGLITLKDSNWLLTINSFHNPHFTNQPPDTHVWWGYGLYLDCPGNFVSKKMTECTGAEILEEVIRHLGFDRELDAIIASANCIPSLLPYAGSILRLRLKGDRPEVVPAGSKNIAFLGQFVEVPDEVIFTTEYSVRAARIAVAKLLRTDHMPPPVYQGHFDPKVLLAATRALTG
jgi:oleate hydratase